MIKSRNSSTITLGIAYTSKKGGLYVTRFSRKNAEVLFETGYHFALNFSEDGEALTYASLREEDNGKTETLPIAVHKLGDGLYTVNWHEADGHTVSHNIDLNTGTAWAYMTWPDETKPSGRDVLTHKGSYTLKTDRPFTNKQIVIDFWNRFFNDKDVSAADEYLAPPYTQHNPHVPDGVEAFVGYFSQAFQGELKDSSHEVKYVAVDGDRVLIHNYNKSNPDDLGKAAVDMFRVQNGKIVEHWDVLQDFPAPGTAANEHPMF